MRVENLFSRKSMKSLTTVVSVMADDGAGVWLNGSRVAMIIWMLPT